MTLRPQTPLSTSILARLKKVPKSQKTEMDLPLASELPWHNFKLVAEQAREQASFREAIEPVQGWGGRGQGDEVCITPGGARCGLLLGQERQGVYYSWEVRITWGSKEGEVCITPGGEVCITPGAGEPRCVLLPPWERPEECMTPGAGEAWCRLLPGGQRPEVCITPGVQFCLTPGAGKARCVLLWVWGERERGEEVCVTPKARCVLLQGWGGRGQGDEVCITPGVARCGLLLGQERQGVYYSRGGGVLLGGKRGAYYMGLERG